MMSSFTVLTSPDRPLGKTMTLGHDGAIRKKACATVTAGRAERRSVTTLEEYVALRQELTGRQALAYGTCAYDTALISTKKKLGGEIGPLSREGLPTLARTRSNFGWPAGPGIMMLDHDPLPQAQALTGAQLRAALCHALPVLEDVQMVWMPSTGSCVFDAVTGEEKVPLRGSRMYFRVADAAVIPAIGKILLDRLALAGNATIMISKDGAMLRRWIVDSTVWQPERLDFVRATCAQPLEQRFQPPEFFGPAGGMLALADLSPAALTCDEKKRLADLWTDKESGCAVEARRVREQWALGQARKSLGDFASTAEIAAKAQDFVLAADNGRLVPEHVLVMQSGERVKVAEVLAAPDDFSGARLHDPMEPDYGGPDPRIALIVVGRNGAVWIHSHAHGERKYLLRGDDTAETDLDGLGDSDDGADVGPERTDSAGHRRGRIAHGAMPLSPTRSAGNAARTYDGDVGGVKPRRPTLVNLSEALSNPEVCGVRIALDDFDGRIKLSKSMDLDAWVNVVDADLIDLRLELQRSAGFGHISRELMSDTLQSVARHHRFDSAQLWLSCLTWDGKSRVSTMLAKYFAAGDTAYTRAVSEYIWTALAGRVLQPGLKCDMVPVAVGAQGARKSSTVKAMVPAQQFFAELSLAERDDDLRRRMLGKLVCEMAELQGISTREDESIKAFLSQTDDAWIPKFKEFETAVPRRCLFFGTSNHDDFLRDATGHRRWLPFKVGKCDPDAMADDHEQLWAEAAEMFRAKGLRHAEAERLARDVHCDFVSHDAWEQPIEKWLLREVSASHGATSKPFFTTHDLLYGAVGLDNRTMAKAHEMRLSRVMATLGWQGARSSAHGRARGYEPLPKTAEALAALAAASVGARREEEAELPL